MACRTLADDRWRHTGTISAERTSRLLPQDDGATAPIICAAPDGDPEAVCRKMAMLRHPCRASRWTTRQKAIWSRHRSGQ
jgi:hypothetical protein